MTIGDSFEPYTKNLYKNSLIYNNFKVIPEELRTWQRGNKVLNQISELIMFEWRHK